MPRMMLFRVLFVLSICLVGLYRPVLCEWSTQEAVTPDDPVIQRLSDCTHHCVAVDGFGKVHAVWQDWGVPVCIRYNSRTPGSGWGTESFRVSPPGVYEPEDPTICCNVVGNVFVAWHVQGDTTGRVQVNYRMYDPSSGWDSETGLVDNSSSYYPSAAMDDSGNVHVVWVRASSPLKNRVMYRKFVPDHGWSDALFLSESLDSYCDGLTIAEDAGSLHVVWAEADNSTGYCNVYYRRYSPDAGWDSAPTQVNQTDLSVYSWMPSVAVSPDGCVHVVYTTYGVGGAQEIMYRRWSPSSGWDETVTPVSSDDSIHSTAADVACDDLGHIHVVWHDGRDGGYEIYERVLTPGVGWSEETPLTANENGDMNAHLISGTCGLHLVWRNVSVYYMNYIGSSSGVPRVDISPADELPGVHASPNPFSEMTTIVYRLSRPGAINLEIYSVTGQVVTELVKGYHAGGDYDLVWDGRCSSGKRVQPGVYFLSLRNGTRTDVQSIVLLN